MSPLTFTTPSVTSRLPDVGTTIFSVMSQLATEHDAINLGQGFPNFDPAPALLEAAHQSLASGNHQYAPMTGLRSLRSVIADKTKRLTGHLYDLEDEITVTAGATIAISAAVTAIVHPGDEVIVLEPVYDSYIPSIRLAGGIPVVVPLRAPTEHDPVFRPDWDKVQAAISSKTRAIMLNFPHNPTGTILTQTDLEALVALLSGTNILVISDEVYEHIVFDGYPHLSMASHPFLAARSFVISSFGKTVHATGWKIGYCCAPASLSLEFRRVHQFGIFAVNSTLQRALAEYLTEPSTYENLADFYQEKRDYLAQGLQKLGFEVLPSQGTFFLTANYQQLSSLPPDAFARWLTEAYQVTVIPLSAFYTTPDGAQQPLVRFCFAKTTEVLDEALKRLGGLSSLHTEVL